MMNEELINEIKVFIEEFYDLEDIEEIEIVKYSGWVSEGKYDSNETIIKYKEKFFCVSQLRTGSYYSDYEYMDSNVYEVEPKQVMTTIYERIIY